jgi:hypothetical protein
MATWWDEQVGLGIKRRKQLTKLHTAPAAPPVEPEPVPEPEPEPGLDPEPESKPESGSEPEPEPEVPLALRLSPAQPREPSRPGELAIPGETPRRPRPPPFPLPAVALPAARQRVVTLESSERCHPHPQSPTPCASGGAADRPARRAAPRRCGRPRPRRRPRPRHRRFWRSGWCWARSSGAGTSSWQPWTAPSRARRRRQSRCATRDRRAAGCRERTRGYGVRSRAG